MKSSLILARVALAIAIFVTANPANVLRAQATTPEAAAAAALDLSNRGQTNEAIAAYEKILKDYPTSAVIPEAQFRVGYLSFILGNEDRSLEMLGKVTAPPAPQEIQELAGSLIPQVLSAKAGKMKTDDPKRKAAFENAIQQFDAFITKYPTNLEVESAIYGRSLAQYQIKKYEEAAAGLRLNLSKFPKSESIQDSEFLLAVTLMALEKDKEAEKWLRGIIERNTDVALANDAQFQLGELLFNRAIASEGAAQAAMYGKAIEAYQAVKSKALVEKGQKARMEGFLVRMREAGTRHDVATIKYIQRLQKLETAKIGALKGKPETAIGAQIKIGICDFQLQKYKEATEIFLKMQPLTTDDVEKKQIQFYLTLCYASQNDIANAVASYDEFQSKYKGDPIADNLALAMGGMFINASRAGGQTPDAANLEKAIQYLKESQQIYPNGRYAAQAALQQGAALVQLHRLEEAQAVYKSFLATNPKPDQAATVELGLAGIAKDTGKQDEALAGYKALRDNPKYAGLPEVEQAAFWVGQLALLKGDAKTAITEMAAFLDKYPDSTLRPSAMFALAQAQQATGAKDKSLAGFKELVAKYPKSDAAPYAYFQLASIYAADQKVDDMVEMMKIFIKNYPTNDKIYYAYDTIGQSQINAGKPLDAIATYSEMALG